MKYAFIALIAIYLVVYGCSPDSSEKATDNHETTAPATLEKPHQAAEVAAVPADPHEPDAAAHAEQQTADAVKDAVVEEPAAAAEVVEEPAAAEVVEEPAAAEVVEEPAAAAEVVEEPAAAAEVVEEPAVAAETAEQAQPVVEKQQPAEVAKPQLVVMPCGRTMARANIPKNAPCLKQPAQTAAVADTKQDINAALQRMLETTNDMVLATQQLVIATQQMLNASKEIIETPEETQPVEQAVEGQGPAAKQQ
jgi:ribonuclease E